MKLTKERKIYALVLGLAAGGLTLDQAILGGGATGPQRAAADPVNAVAAAAVANAQTALLQINRAAATLSDENGLAHRLASFAAEQNYALPDVADAFAPDASWMGAEPVRESGEAAVVAEAVDMGAQFKARYVLSAVMSSSAGGIAVIAPAEGGARQSMLVGVGQSVEGFELVSISPGAAVFSRGEATAVLELKQVDVRPSARPLAGPGGTGM